MEQKCSKSRQICIPPPCIKQSIRYKTETTEGGRVSWDQKMRPFSGSGRLSMSQFCVNEACRFEVIPLKKIKQTQSVILDRYFVALRGLV